MKRLLLLPLLVLVLVACGGGDDGTEETASAASSSSSASTATASEEAAPFPVTIEHKYGETTIESQPERVVTVGFNDQDAILALGVVPVGIRDWYGEQPQATWPWAHDLLEGQEPEVLPAESINVEAVAALRPDVIIGVSSGMTREEYDTLSAVAPTITQSGDFPDYGMPWREGMLMIGDALGKRTEAELHIAEVDGLLAEIRAEHPELEGATGTVSYVLDETEVGAYAPSDVRSQLLLDLGMVIPDTIVEAAGDQFYSSFSYEEIGRLEADVVVWINGDPAIVEQIKAHPLRQQMTANAEGREIFLTEMEAGMASFSSVLSLPVLLESFVPKLVAAVDGDPATEVPA